MKKSKSRFILCLVTSFIMAFTVIPFMGNGQVSAATIKYDEHTPTIRCPIETIEWLPDSSGDYDLNIILDTTIYSKSNMPDYNVIDTCNYTIRASGSSDTISYAQVNGVDITKGSVKIREATNNRLIKPGEEVWIYVQFGSTTDGDYGDRATTLLDENKNSISFLGYYFNAPEAEQSVGETFDVTGTANNITSASYGKEVWAKEFKADSSYTLKVDYSMNPANALASGYFQIKGNKDTEATRIYNGSYDIKADDTYKLSFIHNSQSSGTVSYTLTAKLVKKYVPSNRFETCTMKKSEESTNKYKVEIAASNLDYCDPNKSATHEQTAAGQSGTYFYRVCGNVIKCISVQDVGTFNKNAGYTDYPTLDKTYTYYVLKGVAKDEHFTNDNLPASGKSVTLTASQMNKLTTKLAYYGNQAKANPGGYYVTIPAPVVATVKDFKLYVHKDVPKYRRLMWGVNNDGGVTGYIVKRYDYQGNFVKSFDTGKISAPDTISEARKYYVPYSSRKDRYTAQFKVQPYYTYNGKTYLGEESVMIKTKSVRIKAPTAKITKISNSKAKITINKASNSAGTVIYQYTGGEWKKIGSTTGTKYTVTYNKSKGSSKTPGKVKYKFKSYLTDNGSTFYSDSYSTEYSPKANYRSWNYSKYQSDYKDYYHFWKPIKIYYYNGKVKLTGRWINTHNYRLDYFNIKVTVKCDGKVIGTKTLKCGTMAANSTKKHSAVTISTTPGYDLRNGNTSISYKVISWY